MKPTGLLGEVMSTQIRTATADQILEEIDHHFEVVSGLPVIDAELKCIGVVSKQDRNKASHGVSYILSLDLFILIRWIRAFPLKKKGFFFFFFTLS